MKAEENYKGVGTAHSAPYCEVILLYVSTSGWQKSQNILAVSLSGMVLLAVETSQDKYLSSNL